MVTFACVPINDKWHAGRSLRDFIPLSYRSLPRVSKPLGDWSLITGRGGGGLQNGRGGHMKFYPYEKGGSGKSFSHAEGGGHKKFWGSFYAVA